MPSDASAPVEEEDEADGGNIYFDLAEGDAIRFPSSKLVLEDLAASCEGTVTGS